MYFLFPPTCMHSLFSLFHSLILIICFPFSLFSFQSNYFTHSNNWLFQAKRELGKRNIIHERKAFRDQSDQPTRLNPKNRLTVFCASSTESRLLYDLSGCRSGGIAHRNRESGSFCRATGQVLCFKHIRIGTEWSRHRNSASCSSFLLTSLFLPKALTGLDPAADLPPA